MVYGDINRRGLILDLGTKTDYHWATAPRSGRNPSDLYGIFYHNRRHCLRSSKILIDAITVNMHFSALVVILFGHIVVQIWNKQVKQSHTSRLSRPANTTLPPANRELIDQELIYDQPPPVDPEDNQWEVEKLVSKRRIRRTVWYLVKWKGYSAGENSWQERMDIHPQLVNDYEARHRRRRHNRINSGSYLHGKLPGRSLDSGIYITRFRRRSYPSWKVLGTFAAARRPSRACGIRMPNRDLRRCT